MSYISFVAGLISAGFMGLSAFCLCWVLVHDRVTDPGRKIRELEKELRERNKDVKSLTVALTELKRKENEFGRISP